MSTHFPFTITPLVIPSVPSGPDFREFVEFTALGNGMSRALWKNDDFVYSAVDVLPSYQPQDFLDKLVHVARIGQLMVGRLVADFPLDPNAETVVLAIDVVPAVRRRGIGSALLSRGEDLARDGGRTVVSVFTEHPAAQFRARTPLVRAAEGPSGVPAARPEVRFLRHRGYTLGQVEQSSQLNLPLGDDLLARILNETVSSTGGYRLHQWWQRTPRRFLERFARLRGLMSRQVPQSGIVLDHEEWGPPRIRSLEQLMIDRGEPLLTTAAEHVASGELVAYTDIVVPGGSKAEQNDTLVAPGHRGHRLGTWIKAANLERLMEIAPETRRLITWNAAENEHMLAVNALFGFTLLGRDGNWQRHLD